MHVPSFRNVFKERSTLSTDGLLSNLIESESEELVVVDQYSGTSNFWIHVTENYKI